MNTSNACLIRTGIKIIDVKSLLRISKSTIHIRNFNNNYAIKLSSYLLSRTVKIQLRKQTKLCFSKFHSSASGN